MDLAARIIVRSAAKLLIEAANRCEMTKEENDRVAEATRKLMKALSAEDRSARRANPSPSRP